MFGDPLTTTLATGVDIGLLGIELHTRRRNRLNGEVKAFYAEGFEVQVEQSFGNCPQYMQARQFEMNEFDPAVPKPLHEFTTFGVAERSLLTTADTFFIATADQDESAGAAGGVDVSYRGGQTRFCSHRWRSHPDDS